MNGRKGLHPAIAFALMLAMLCCALCYGAHKHWRAEQKTVAAQALMLETAMDVRAETAQNLLTVARRHLPQDDALCISVSSSGAVIENTALPLHERITACRQLTEDAQLLLQQLMQLPAVRSDSRDRMYAELMLPQAVDLIRDETAFTAYDQAAEAYNKGLGSSLSGVLAQMTGCNKAPRTEGMQPALAVREKKTVDYPVCRGFVNDDAAVLSEDTADDIEALNLRMVSAQFVVATRHFLGGEDVQEYCKGLFDAWQLAEDEVLLLLVIGEERYAVMMGDKIRAYVSDEQLHSLTGAHLRGPFIAQRDYDGAAGDFLLALAGSIARASGEKLQTGGLFGTAEAAPQTIFDNWSGNWWEGFFTENDYDEEALQRHAGDRQEKEKTDWSTLMVLAFVMFMTIRRRRKSGKDSLGWFGWLIAIAIISEIGDMIGRML